jgi:hypothetical protein
MLHMAEFRISGYKCSFLFQSRGQGKGVGIGDGVAGLQFGGAADEFIDLLLPALGRQVSPRSNQ